LEAPKAAEITTQSDNTLILKDADLKVYPNPFSEKLRFEFVSPESVNARIDLYDMTGRMVKTIFEAPVEAGVSYEAEFRPESIISGIYIYRVTLGEAIYNGKVVFKKY
ncbi:MAG TPA: T9SS type A sorting domain-containing protein, partial [Draconibacterium sp.]|nr:T9SS type A sorting domain-containing protein [Draconibacterium sp.]